MTRREFRAMVREVCGHVLSEQQLDAIFAAADACIAAEAERIARPPCSSYPAPRREAS